MRLDPKFALAWALLSYVDASGYIIQVFNRQSPSVKKRGKRPRLRSLLSPISVRPYWPTAITTMPASRTMTLRCDTLNKRVRFCPMAAGFLNRWPMSRDGGASGTGVSRISTKPSASTREMSTCSANTRVLHHASSFPRALRKLDQVLNITPDDADTLAIKATVAQAEGDLPRAAALLAPLHPNSDDSFVLETQAYQEILERRPGQIITRLKEILTKPDPALGFSNGELRFWLGWAQEVAGDHASAQASWSQARGELESFLKEQPDNYFLIGYLALTNIALGDKAAALLCRNGLWRAADRKRQVNGPIPLEILSRVAAQTGEPDRAIAALQKLLSTRYAGAFPAGPITPALLRLDPMFDPLRNDPRFRKLCQQ